MGAGRGTSSTCSATTRSSPRWRCCGRSSCGVPYVVTFHGGGHSSSCATASAAAAAASCCGRCCAGGAGWSPIARFEIEEYGAALGRAAASGSRSSPTAPTSASPTATLRDRRAGDPDAGLDRAPRALQGPPPRDRGLPARARARARRAAPDRRQRAPTKTSCARQADELGVADRVEFTSVPPATARDGDAARRRLARRPAQRLRDPSAGRARGRRGPPPPAGRRRRWAGGARRRRVRAGDPAPSLAASTSRAAIARSSAEPLPRAPAEPELLGRVRRRAARPLSDRLLATGRIRSEVQTSRRIRSDRSRDGRQSMRRAWPRTRLLASGPPCLALGRLRLRLGAVAAEHRPAGARLTSGRRRHTSAPRPDATDGKAR